MSEGAERKLLKQANAKRVLTPNTVVFKMSEDSQVVKYLASHHCPLQSGGADKESKMDCPR